ncbi:hypothetical protein CGZ93_02615 [Enemella dayhoffiae]|uniref:Peptidase S54 rhomboid domain-containing protein n=1 Tax=Enemella dayhoffiae TaxID=2016507 RepID=A0A255HCE6_9ACTN|nr:rhomboid family intramembrane serine protease [Enemella dayhoffiae]OYO24613.1 hypothetical protein CGZ93_02615 [Enemella dayhoffiae]
MTEGRDDSRERGERPDFTWEEFAKGHGSGGRPAPSDDERFKPCFRHAGRSTGITCQRCDRPICGECMRPASVGFQCPVCVAEQQMSTPPGSGGGRGSGRGRFGGFGGRGSSGSTPRSLGGLRLSGGPVSTTAALMVAMGSVGLIDLFTGGFGRGIASQVLAYSGQGIASGQLWRLVTGVVVPDGGLFTLLLNLLFMWLIGRDVEAAFGRGRMLAIAVIAGLGSAAALSLLYPMLAWGLAYSAILGLLAARAALGFRNGEDVRGYLILFGLMVLVNLVLGSLPGAISLLGAIIGGAAAGALLSANPRGSRTSFDVVSLSVLGVVLAGICIGRVLI